MAISDILFYLAVILGIIIFLKLSPRIPLFQRILISLAAILILFLVFFFISIIIAFIILIIVIIFLFSLLSARKFKFKKIRLK